jgi:hypothetical protein
MYAAVNKRLATTARVITFTNTINGLTPSSTYNLMAYATNAQGTGYSNNSPFHCNLANIAVFVSAFQPRCYKFSGIGFTNKSRKK